MKGSVMQTTSNNSILVDFYSATNLGDDLLLHALIIAAEMLRRSRLRCCGVPRCAATR